MPGDLQGPKSAELLSNLLVLNELEKIKKEDSELFEFLTESIDKLLYRTSIEDDIENLLLSSHKYKHSILHGYIHNKINQLELRLGHKANSNKLFRIIKRDHSRNFSQEYARLFSGEISCLNKIVSECISRIPLLNEIFKEKTGRKAAGVCEALSNSLGYLGLESKEEFDYLLSLANCNVEKLNEENFEKFLRNELEDKRLIDLFSFIKILIEEVTILEARNINLPQGLSGCGDCGKPLPVKYLEKYVRLRSFNVQDSQFSINRKMILEHLTQMENKGALYFGLTGHAIAVAK